VLVLPGLDGIRVEDAADRARADRLVQRGRGKAGEITQRLAAERASAPSDFFTGQGGDLGAVKRGKR
jgi:ribose 1,5-bisphosphokinase PhnN